ncbi:MAG: two-component sensor histidine kinase, partial [Leifsonia sp.]
MTRRWSLQRRLVVALVLLLAVVSVVVGTASVLALRENLLQRLDQQVAAELSFVERADGPGGGGDPAPPSQDEDDGEGARSSVRLVVISNVVVIAEHVDEQRQRTLLTPSQQRALAKIAAGDPTTLHLDGLGDFRVQAENAQGRLYVVGLSLDELNDTTTSLILIFGLVALAALAVAALAGTIVVRVALRPLERVAATATRVSELPLAKGEVTLA